MGAACRGARRQDPRGGASPPRGARAGAGSIGDEPAEGPGRWRLHHAAASVGVRADRPGHERPRLVRAHPGRVGARGDDRRADRAVAEAGDPGRAERVLRDHRGGRGVRRRRDRGDRDPRRRRLRARRREDARDVVQPRRSHLLPGEAHRRRARGRARAVRGRQGHARRPARTRASLHAHLPRHARDRRVRRRPGAGVAADRRRGRRDELHLRVVPLRAPDDRAPGAAARPSG